MKILIVDNYDSFTYNLYQYTGELMKAQEKGFRLDVYRNDEITVKEIQEKKYNRIIISPGPGSPDDSQYFGVCAEVLTRVGQEIPVFGVCLGMQGMAHSFGGRVIRAPLPMHGKTSLIMHDGKGVFKGLPQGIAVMRYHSLVADASTLPEMLEVTASVIQPVDTTVTTDIREIPFEKKQLESVNSGMLKREVLNSGGEIMGLRHTKYPIEGIQFHPESFATEGGKTMLLNFLMQS